MYLKSKLRKAIVVIAAGLVWMTAKVMFGRSFECPHCGVELVGSPHGDCPECESRIAA